MADFFSNEQGGVSKTQFNEAYFNLKRLDELQTRINMAKFNLKAYNIELSLFNYEVVYRGLCSLLNEIWAKLTEEEKNVSSDYQDKLREYIDNIKFFKPKNKNSKDLIFYGDKWARMEKYLDKFEKMIKEYMNIHGISNPDLEEGMF